MAMIIAIMPHIARRERAVVGAIAVAYRTEVHGRLSSTAQLIRPTSE